MAEVEGVLIKDLAEQTTASPTDNLIIGGADAKKITVHNYEKSHGSFVHYIVGSGGTAANTTSGSYYAARWVGTDSSITELYNGLTIAFKVQVAGNGTYGTTLNLNGYGEHPIVYNINSAISTRYGVGSIVVMTYDSAQTASAYKNNVSTSYTGCWKVMDYDSTNLYQDTHISNFSYKTKTALYRYKICFTNIYGDTIIPANTVNNSTANNKALTTEPFDLFGPIFYYNSTTTKAANDPVQGNTLYDRCSLDLRQSFNTGTTLTANKPVYLKCDIDPINPCEGTLSSTPIVQPGVGFSVSDADLHRPDFVYIYLGMAYSTYQIELDTIGARRVYSYYRGHLVPYDPRDRYEYSGFLEVDAYVPPIPQ